jgi:hypothetical protein
LLFCRDLEGYGWCVRKGHYLNVGIGPIQCCLARTCISRLRRWTAAAGWRGSAPGRRCGRSRVSRKRRGD